MICAYPWSCQKALAVAACESTLNPNATNGSQIGLFQIASQYHSGRLQPGESLYDPEANVRIAYEIYSEQGWAPWPYCGSR